MPVQCFCCGATFEDYAELAKHVSASKKGHRKSKKWAADYMLKTRQLNQKRDLPQRIPLTEEQKDNYQETKRELSGEYENVICLCPRCKLGHREQVPTEYSHSEQAWRSPKGTLMMICQRCK